MPSKHHWLCRLFYCGGTHISTAEENIISPRIFPLNINNPAEPVRKSTFNVILIIHEVVRDLCCNPIRYAKHLQCMKIDTQNVTPDDFRVNNVLGTIMASMSDRRQTISCTQMLTNLTFVMIPRAWPVAPGRGGVLSYLWQSGRRGHSRQWGCVRLCLRSPGEHA